MPVRKAQIIGWVVGIVQKQSRRLLDIDDGTGVICCIEWQKDQDQQPLDLGDIVLISGRIIKYREEMQLDIWAIKSSTVEQEYLFKLKVLELQAIYQLQINADCLDNNDVSGFKNYKPDIKVNLITDSTELELSKLLMMQYSKACEFDQVCKSEQVMDRYQQLTTLEAGDNAYRLMLSKITQKLVQDGKIFETSPESDIYSAVNESNLGNQILKILRSETINGGIYFDELMVILKREQRFSKVGKQTVLNMLSEQSADGKVSEIENRKYVSC